MGEQATLIDVPAFNGNDDENQRFTLPSTLAWARVKGGVTYYDVDVAACEEAHCAPVWFSRAQDGLIQQWWGDVWCNPPWGDIEPWVLKAWRAWSEPEYDGLSLISISMLLPGDRRHRPWWQNLVAPFRDQGPNEKGITLATHDPPFRPAYGHPGNPRGIGCVEPNFTSVLLVWRRA